MKVSSTTFENGGEIPSKYSCDGDNINPPLMISGIPEGAKSLVLIMDDPDIPDTVKRLKNIEVFDHWLIYNITPETEGFSETGTLNIEEGKEPAGVKGLNSSGTLKYMGPCPPDTEHRYFFKVHALSSLIDLPEGATKKEVELAMDGLVLDSAQIIGRYKRI